MNELILLLLPTAAASSMLTILVCRSFYRKVMRREKFRLEYQTAISGLYGASRDMAYGRLGSSAAVVLQESDNPMADMFSLAGARGEKWANDAFEGFLAVHNKLASLDSELVESESDVVTPLFEEYKKEREIYQLNYKVRSDNADAACISAAKVGLAEINIKPVIGNWGEDCQEEDATHWTVEFIRKGWANRGYSCHDNRKDAEEAVSSLQTL
ncbi:TPA: hypothetical protein N3A50_004358 [Salmonella enterica subsp. salamae serovar 30:g,m,s:e,n,x]|nr:hypothetical protein [Salmonella enterica subsp. salamae serovar 30:g,m,s:e,n,x]